MYYMYMYWQLSLTRYGSLTFYDTFFFSYLNSLTIPCPPPPPSLYIGYILGTPLYGDVECIINFRQPYFSVDLTLKFISHFLSNDLKASELHCAIDSTGAKSLILVRYLHGMHIHVPYCRVVYITWWWKKSQWDETVENSNLLILISELWLIKYLTQGSVFSLVK